jgi:hypothetical protein
LALIDLFSHVLWIIYLIQYNVLDGPMLKVMFDKIQPNSSQNFVVETDEAMACRHARPSIKIRKQSLSL